MQSSFKPAAGTEEAEEALQTAAEARGFSSRSRGRRGSEAAAVQPYELLAEQHRGMEVQRYLQVRRAHAALERILSRVLWVCFIRRFGSWW